MYCDFFHFHSLLHRLVCSQLVVPVLGDVANPRQGLVAALLDDLQVADLLVEVRGKYIRVR